MTLEISTDRDRLDVAMIHAFLANESYWVSGMALASYANLLDVFILPKFRDPGIGKLLMQHILSHPESRSIVRHALGTQDAHGLCSQFGFSAFANPERQMELLRPPSAAASGSARTHGCDKVIRKN